MSLITDQETRPWGRWIKNKVMAGEMPPWHADPSVWRFLDARRLTEAERHTIVLWVDAAAPEGDPAKLSPAPVFADGWEIGTPDVIVEMPKAFEVPAEDEVASHYVSAPTNFTEDKWVWAVEMRAGSLSVVHHILAYARARRRAAALRVQVDTGRRAGSEAHVVSSRKRASVCPRPSLFVRSALTPSLSAVGHRGSGQAGRAGDPGARLSTLLTLAAGRRPRARRPAAPVCGGPGRYC